jgi:ABC-type multidrug transport system fused ATPase/permease subunit
MHRKFDTWDSISAHIWVMNRWLGIRMAVLSVAFTVLMGTIVVVSPGIGSALGGFALSFAVDFALNMIFAIRIYSQLELDMNGTERVVEYTELKIETQEGQEPPAAWPTSGRFEVEDLVVAYADDLPPVLRGISFDVKDNERIGVVGRTGAGKSSLTLALFRFLESRSGKVIIDGLDISKIDLHSLLSHKTQFCSRVPFGATWTRSMTTLTRRSRSVWLVSIS